MFGRQEEVERTFAEENDELYEASFGAQFVSGLIMPTMMFIGNLNYVVIAVLGGDQGRQRVDQRSATCRPSSSTPASSPSR